MSLSSHVVEQLAGLFENRRVQSLPECGVESRQRAADFDGVVPVTRQPGQADQRAEFRGTGALFARNLERAPEGGAPP